MNTEFIDNYRTSSKYFQEAMQEAICLINIDSELYKVDFNIMRLAQTEITAPESNFNRFLYSQKTEIMHRRANSVNKLNSLLVYSLNELFLLLKRIIEIHSSADEVALCQKLLNSIIAFINKPYVINDIDISAIERSSLLLILKYDEKKEDYPQFDQILNNLIKIHNIAYRPIADRKAVLEKG